MKKEFKVIPRHQCEKCLDFMRAEKTSEGYVLKCPECEEMQNRDEDFYC